METLNKLTYQAGVTTHEDVLNNINSNADASNANFDAIKKNKQDNLTFDNTPTDGSNNPVTSGGVKSYVDGNTKTINDLLAEGYLFAGIATPATNPGTPDGNVFYIASESGTYSNFGGASVKNEVCLLVYNGTGWNKNNVLTIDSTPTEGSNNPVTSGAVKSYVDRKQDKTSSACISPGKNLFDWRSSIFGKFISTNGVITDNPNYGISNYIPFNGKNIYSEYGTKGGTTAEIYDDNFVKIATIQAGTKLFQYQSGYSYLRFCFKISEKEKIQYEYGDSQTEFEQFNPYPYMLDYVYGLEKSYINQMEKPYSGFDLEALFGSGAVTVLSTKYFYDRSIYSNIQYITSIEYAGATNQTLNLYIVEPVTYQVLGTYNIDVSNVYKNGNIGIYKFKDPLFIGGNILAVDNVAFKVVFNAESKTYKLNNDSTISFNGQIVLAIKINGYDKFIGNGQITDVLGQDKNKVISQYGLNNIIQTIPTISQMFSSNSDAVSNQGDDFDLSLVTLENNNIYFALSTLGDRNGNVNFINKAKVNARTSNVVVAIMNLKDKTIKEIGTYSGATGVREIIFENPIFLGKYETLGFKGVGFKAGKTSKDFILRTEDFSTLKIQSDLFIGVELYGKIIQKNFELTVGEQQDFATISSAIDFATNMVKPYKENRCTIKIYPGEYVEQLVMRDGPTYINLVGTDKKTCIVRDNTGDYETPPLEIGASNSVRELTFLATHDDNPDFNESTHGSYAIHADYSGGEPGDEVLIEDCIMISYCHNALGSGLWNERPLVVRRCECYGLKDIGSGNNAIAMHNGTVGTGQQTFIVEDCILRSVTKSVLKLSEAYAGKNVNIRLVNNILYSDATNEANQKPYANSDEIVTITPVTGGEDCISGGMKLDGISCKNNVSILNSIYQK